ncbi:alpha-1-3-mannosyltransferase CMT1 [Penicillium capsulatum]|uniref:Alpha-1-3-mannosyltransferase CMT1 n=1 Tax=Penicillium capsulatum TaxID=69766 RepID=A0A9W9LG78_9EURO|nr:alpha-1-3-mannosyltransferase CMT1 [Penicillium capsulatum]KAJ6106159.1 alpha-1-3-mannosyltransferase CMT1 [Penicillium capsulatum]
MSIATIRNDNDTGPCDALNASQLASLQVDLSQPHIYTHQEVSNFVCSIVHHQMNVTVGLECASSASSRYEHLQPAQSSKPKIHYFFALDLHQAVHIIIPLMGSLIEAMRYLGPEHCALSIVEGRSTDGTYEILSALKTELSDMGVPFFLDRSYRDPKAAGENRITALSELRNKALEPLLEESNRKHNRLASHITIVFVNDVVLCPEDILEMLHQRVLQSAAMTCAFDWNKNDGAFYDSWVSRSMSGNLFFEVTHDAAHWLAPDMFFDHPDSADRWHQSLPIQVYSCWGGMATLDATPFLQRKITFRSPGHDECYMGEPMTLAKDLWRLGLGRILAVPTVSVAYEYNDTSVAKASHGYVHKTVDSAQYKKDLEMVKWQTVPPPMVKCMPVFNRQSWMPPV